MSRVVQLDLEDKTVHTERYVKREKESEREREKKKKEGSVAEVTTEALGARSLVPPDSRAPRSTRTLSRSAVEGGAGGRRRPGVQWKCAVAESIYSS